MGRILDDVSKWPIEKKRAKLEEVYLDRVGMRLDLDNPKRFTEKIQWQKLYDDDQRKTRIVNKLTFKQYVREKLNGEYSAPLIDVWHNPGDVDMSLVPEKCVIKSNCASEGRYCYVLDGKSQFDKKEMEIVIRDTWFDWRYLNTNSFHRAYYGVKPCVLIEKYLFDPKDVDEYKIYCFSGTPRYLYRYSNHFKDGKNMYGHYPIGFYSAEWEYLGVRIGTFEVEKPRPKPAYLGELMDIAQKLSADFSFVRVDFFVDSDRFYIAEMCFGPFTGLEPYYPVSFDYEMGALWDYPPKKHSCGGVV